MQLNRFILQEGRGRASRRSFKWDYSEMFKVSCSYLSPSLKGTAKKQWVHLLIHLIISLIKTNKFLHNWGISYSIPLAIQYCLCGSAQKNLAQRGARKCWGKIFLHFLNVFKKPSFFTCLIRIVV